MTLRPPQLVLPGPIYRIYRTCPRCLKTWLTRAEYAEENIYVGSEPHNERQIFVEVFQHEGCGGETFFDRGVGNVQDKVS